MGYATSTISKLYIGFRIYDHTGHADIYPEKAKPKAGDLAAWVWQMPDTVFGTRSTQLAGGVMA
jgi:hypothetical protein